MSLSIKQVRIHESCGIVFNMIKIITVWLVCSVLVLSSSVHLAGECCAQDSAPVAMDQSMECHSTDDSQSDTDCLECVCDQCHTNINTTGVAPRPPQYRVADYVDPYTSRYLQMHAYVFHPPKPRA